MKYGQASKLPYAAYTADERLAPFQPLSYTSPQTTLTYLLKSSKLKFEDKDGNTKAENIDKFIRELNRQISLITKDEPLSVSGSEDTGKGADREFHLDLWRRALQMQVDAAKILNDAAEASAEGVRKAVRNIEMHTAAKAYEIQSKEVQINELFRRAETEPKYSNALNKKGAEINKEEYEKIIAPFKGMEGILDFDVISGENISVKEMFDNALKGFKEGARLIEIQGAKLIEEAIIKSWISSEETVTQAIQKNR